tara:strand:+ start:412 stop:1827 length:1416 start_codon:yes stop_codon:yes gene_type:complete
MGKKFDEADMRVLAEQITGVPTLRLNMNEGTVQHEPAFGDVAMRYACNIQNLSYLNFSIVLTDPPQGFPPELPEDFPVHVYRDDAYDKNPITFIKKSLQYTTHDMGRAIFDYAFRDWDSVKIDLENAKVNGWPKEEDMTPAQKSRYNRLESLWTGVTEKDTPLRNVDPNQIIRDLGPLAMNMKVRAAGSHAGVQASWLDIYAETQRNKIVICPITSIGLGHAMTAIFFDNQMYFADPDGDNIEMSHDRTIWPQDFIDEVKMMHGKDFEEETKKKAAHRNNMLRLIKENYKLTTGADLNVSKQHILPVNNCLKDSVVKSKIEPMPFVTQAYPYLTICFTHYLIITFAMHRLCCNAPKCPGQPDKIIKLFYEKYKGYNEEQSDELVNEFVKASKQAVASREFRSRFKLGALGLAAGALGVRKLSRSLSKNKNSNINTNRNESRNINRNININKIYIGKRKKKTTRPRRRRSRR